MDEGNGRNNVDASEFDARKKQDQAVASLAGMGSDSEAIRMVVDRELASEDRLKAPRKLRERGTLEDVSHRV